MIGVSNFLQQDIESLLETANVKPMVNQVLCHISNTPLSLIDYCQSRGIAVEAYSPIAHGEVQILLERYVYSEIVGTFILI